MSRFFNYIATFVGVISLAVCLVGCGEDKIDIADEIIESPEISEEVLSLVNTDWGASSEQVANSMNGYVLTSQDGELLKFSPKKGGGFAISYGFKDDMLNTALIYIEKTDAAAASKVYSLQGYEYMGDIDGARTYSNITMNNMGIVFERTIDEKEYLVVGFTPIESDLFEDFEPVNVQITEPSKISFDSFTANAECRGTDNVSQAYFYYSTTPNGIENGSKKKATVDSNKLYANITGLTPNTTYYYKAFVSVDNIPYWSETESVELESVKTYKIGDPYPSATKPEGIVCSVKNNGMNGTIVSLDQDYLKWDTNGFFSQSCSASNTSDGSKNKLPSNQPYGRWVADHGPDWFGPAKGQLKFSTSNLKLINEGLRQVNGTVLEGMYWSSTQQTSNEAYVVTITETTYLGYSNQYEFHNTKDELRSVRAMKYF